MPDPWLQGVPDTSRYVAEGKACIEKLLGDDVEGGLALMHENLRAQFEPEKLAAGMSALVGQLGEPVAVDHVSETFQAEGEPALTIRYKVRGSQGDVAGDIVFKFTPWKGQILAIDVPAD
jgi:hypothetical protein